MNDLPPNKIFFNFLKLAFPKEANNFKKKGNIYETYKSLKDVGHKFIYDIQKQLITHLYYKPAFYVGGQYERELASETVKIEFIPNGFKTIRV